MAKKKKSGPEFVQWCIPVIDALRALGDSGRPAEVAQWIDVLSQPPFEN